MKNRTTPLELPVTIPTGPERTCKTWAAEAALRMLLNNLAVAEDPENLIVYGGSGKAARNWECFHVIVKELKQLGISETLLIQSGKPVAVFRTYPHAPRVLIANSHLVPAWATWEEFRRLETMGLIMYGQMTAGSWIYIGTQGIVQGTYETFAAAGRAHFDGTLAGRLIVSGGIGGMGGAQPLAATMNGAAFLGIDMDPARIERRVATGYCDRISHDLDEALSWVLAAKEKKEALSVGLVGNCADLLPELVQRNIVPDIVTDQTSAHDALQGYLPAGLTLAEALKLRETKPADYEKRAMESIATHVRAMLDLQKRGAITFDYGNNIRGQAKAAGVANAFDIPGFVPAYIRPMFCEGRGPFRWVALSGDPEDIYKTDELILKTFPENETLTRWIKLARERVSFEGLPARICWLGYGERARFALLLNDMVASGELAAPIVIGRDHLDCGSVASPNRETEGMLDGSDAIADWPLLNAMLSTASGASWVSLHHGGGVGIGNSIHAGLVVVADGSSDAAKRLERVLSNDPGLGVVRHLDAGYEEASDFAKEHRIKTPMRPKQR